MNRQWLGKLRGRSLAELADRGRQAAWRRLEQAGLGDVGEPVGARLDRLAGPDDGQPVLRGPFFSAFDDRDATLAALRTIDPAYEPALRARADRILTGHIDLLGHRDVAYGMPPDWAADPVAGVRLPDEYWGRIDYLDPAVAGDHKLVFEVARHQWMVTLGQAWWCTRDTRYAAALESALTSWLDATPPKRGVHWGSSLEVAFRGIAWAWVLALAGDVLPRALQRRMLGHLAIGARHVERFLSTWFSPNTHLTGEALGLFVLGTAFPQCADAARWRATGTTILLEWLPRHVRRDGTYVEQSTWYHRYTTDFYLHFRILAARAGLDVRQQVDEPLEALLEVLAWVAGADGRIPLVGDDDGGRLLFLDETTARDARVPLATGAVLLGSPGLAPAAATTELAWLLGPAGVSAFQGLERRSPGATSRVFAEGGTCVVRSGWDAKAAVLVVDAGPHGFRNGGHAHADALSLTLSLAGEVILADPGTGSYTAHPDWRDRFRETASHNAATVDGIGSATFAGPFHWQSTVTAQVDAMHDDDMATLLALSHDGFRRLRPAVSYRRLIAFIKPDLWIVHDEIEGEGDHELAVHWQCDEGVVATTTGDGVALEAGRSRLTMQVAQAGGAWRIEDGWVSPAYGVRRPAAHLRHARRGPGRVSATTVIATGADPVHVQSDVNGTLIRWGERAGTLVVAGAGRPAWIETDAVLAWVEGGAAPRVSAAGVSRLTVYGTGLLDGGAMRRGFTGPR